MSKIWDWFKTHQQLYHMIHIYQEQITWHREDRLKLLAEIQELKDRLGSEGPKDD